MATSNTIAVSPDAWLDLLLLEAEATAGWAPGVRAFIQEGAGAGRAVAANRVAHGKWAMKSRVLVDVSEIDVHTTILGQPVDLPVLVAPSGLHTLVNSEGEVATARGAGAAGSLMILSSGTGRTMEDVRAEKVPTWFQLYWNHDRDRVRRLIGQAADVGCTALCLTADMPVRPLIGASMRAGVASVDQTPMYVLPREAHLEGGVWDHDARLTWRDIEWLRRVSPMPIVVKGIMTSEDAVLAKESGVDAVVVSNHGGRTLDTPWGTVDSLPEIVDGLAGSSVQIYVDGGFRHGSEVLVALALGADAILLGRPILWGLSAGGADGVQGVLNLVASQLKACMGMVGARSLAELDPSRIRRVH